MEIATVRFGSVEVEPADTLIFPLGIIGLETCKQWVLLADATNSALGWLQSSERPEIALAVVSPRRFVPDYQIRVARSELAPLRLAEVEEGKVLVIVGRNEQGITLNLKAPLVFNLARQLGAQVVAKNELSLQYLAPSGRTAWKKTA